MPATLAIKTPLDRARERLALNLDALGRLKAVEERTKELLARLVALEEQLAKQSAELAFARYEEALAATLETSPTPPDTDDEPDTKPVPTPPDDAPVPEPADEPADEPDPEPAA
jgi:hypothetical protein